MTVAISDALHAARAEAVRALLDGASGLPGTVTLYGGTRPTSGGAAGAPLAIVTLAYPCGTADPAGLHLTVPDPAMALATGTVTWCRFADSSGTWLIDGDVALTDGAGGPDGVEIILDRVAVYPGAMITLTAIDFAEQ